MSISFLTVPHRDGACKSLQGMEKIIAEMEKLKGVV